jgi:hypothetical protein
MAGDARVCLIVASYFGERRGGLAGYELLHRLVHSFMAHAMNDIKKVAFLINGTFDQDRVVRIIAPLVGSNRFEISVSQRDNIGMSYGAWNAGIIAEINKKEGYTHYFLLEDDYCVNCDNFVRFYLEKNSAFVASMTSCVPSLHASISNGLLRADIAEAVYKVFDRVFFLKNCSSTEPANYLTAEFNQVHFLDHIALFCLNRGFDSWLSDISGTCRLPFLHRGIPKYYGNCDGVAPLICADLYNA